MSHSHMHEACQHAFLGLDRLYPACAVLPRLLPIRRNPLYRMQSPAVRSLCTDDATITQFCVLCHIWGRGDARRTGRHAICTKLTLRVAFAGIRPARARGGEEGLREAAWSCISMRLRA